jgi:ATP-dependent Clp protease ATP-binding subunit ClpA
MEELENKTQFIACQQCNGSGLTDKGGDCDGCRGRGLGTFFLGNFLYCQLSITRENIALRAFRRRIIVIVDLIAWLLLLTGIACFFLYFWGKDVQSDPYWFYFWQEKSPFLLFFYISCLSASFLFYRSSQKIHDKEKIKKLRESENFPDNWDDLKKYKKSINVSLAYHEKTFYLLEEAYLLSRKLKNKKIRGLHLFLIFLIKSTEVRALLARLNVDIFSFKEKVEYQISMLESGIGAGEELVFDNSVKEALVEAFKDAYNNKQKDVRALNLVIPCLENEPILKEILLDFKVDDNKISNTISWFRINDKQVENYRLYKKLAHFKPSSSMDRAYTAVATPFLNNFGYDLTLAAKWGRLDVCVGREREMKIVFEALESGRSGILLTGPDGVGKRSVIEGIAREMVAEEGVPAMLKDKRLIELDVARLVSGASPTIAQERMLTIIDEINRAGNIILFLENLENIVGIAAGGEESLELSDVLSGELDRGSLLCFATCAESNYIKYIENKAIGNVFARIKINEPIGDQAIMILESKIGYIESRHKVFFSYNAIEAARELSVKFIHDKYLPTKAIDILEKTAARIGNNKKGETVICDRNDIALTINQMTEIPVQDLEDGEGEKLLNLEEEMHKYMIGQHEAVQMVADALRRSRAELRSSNRPIANFLFLGPTGVGKTELAKTITKVYFQKKEFMIRLDMSEYQHEDSVKKMIGDVDGVHGYLTEAVRQKPFSLILLDEFEKANPKIFNLFLQVMDDGRLTDGQGRTVDFTNSIIIATSNAGSDYVQEEVRKGTPMEQLKETLINDHLSKVMRPELVNRFDGIIIFKPLTEEDIEQITKLMLTDIEELLKDKGIGLEVTENGLHLLAAAGYDPKFGARPLRRLIQEKVENEIAKKLLSGEVKRRDIVVINDFAEIDVKKGVEL